MKVSVIIPNYNHASFLEQRINSVLNQTYVDFEIIILDDFSTDNSRNVIEKFRKNGKVVYVVYNEVNSGSTFKQWEKGIGLSTGDLIWIAESDDYADVNFLSTAVSVFIKDSSVVLSCSNSFLVDANNCLLSKNLDDQRKIGIEIFDGKEFIKQKMLYRNMIYNASAVVFRRTVLDHLAKKHMNYRFCGDWLFWNEILCLGKIGRIYEKTNFFRQHDLKVTPMAEREGLDFSEGLKVFENTVRLLDLSSLKQCEVAGSFFYRILLSTAMSKSVKKNVWSIWKKYYRYPFMCISIWGAKRFIDTIFHQFMIFYGK